MRAPDDKSSKPKLIGGRVTQPSKKYQSTGIGSNANRGIGVGEYASLPFNYINNASAYAHKNRIRTGGTPRRPEYNSQVPSASSGIPNLISSVKPSSSETSKVTSAGSGGGSGSSSGGSGSGSNSGSSSVTVTPVDPAKLARQQRLAAMTPAERQAYLNRTSVTVNIPHGTNPAPNVNWGSSGVDPSVAKELNVAMGLQVKNKPLNSRQKHILHMAKVGQLKTVKPLSAGTITTKPTDDRANSAGFGSLNNGDTPAAGTESPSAAGTVSANPPTAPDAPASLADSLPEGSAGTESPSANPIKDQPAVAAAPPAPKPQLSAGSAAPVNKQKELALAAAAQKRGDPLTAHQKHILHEAHVAHMASQIDTQRAANAARGIVNSGQYLGGTRTSLAGGTGTSQRAASPAVPPAVKPKPRTGGGIVAPVA